LSAFDVTLLKLFVSVAATVLLVADAVLRRRGRVDRFVLRRSSALAALALVAALSWWNFFQFGERGFVQGHEFFHYYLGAKYFPELGYTRLYPCTAVAEANMFPRTQFQGRLIREMETNRLLPIQNAIDHPERCTSHFEPDRWREFQQDAAWFRQRIAPDKWRKFFIDHGYNAPPVWGVLGIEIANALDISFSSITAASRIDPALQLIMWTAVAWAFGWRALCVALVFWGTNGLGEFGFLGGAYLRQDWFCMTLLGLCALRRDKHLAAGGLLATAALLRIFPVFLILALGVKTLCAMWKDRTLRPPAAHLRFAGGCLLAAAILVPLSGATGGLDSWPRFIDNIQLHRETPGANNVGLLTLASYHDANLASAELSTRSEERWKADRRELRRERSWLILASWLAYLVLLVRAAGRSPDWVVAILGVGGIFMFLEITAYYYAVLVAYALLHERDFVAGPAICAFSAVSLLLTRYWASSEMVFSHAGLSAALVFLVLGLTWRAGQPPSSDIPVSERGDPPRGISVSGAR
jgi:hypothetical protein